MSGQESRKQLDEAAVAAQHTPGPWTFDPERDEIEAGGGTIAIWTGRALGSFWREEDLPQEVANARLIAAAPDLLAALEAVLGACDDCEDSDCADPRHIVAKSAIAKALGVEPGTRGAPTWWAQ